MIDLNCLVQMKKLNKILSVTTVHVQHGNVVVSNVKGNFIEGETIVGQSSNSSRLFNKKQLVLKVFKLEK